jgi:hypothetical protein
VKFFDHLAASASVATDRRQTIFFSAPAPDERVRTSLHSSPFRLNLGLNELPSVWATAIGTNTEWQRVRHQIDAAMISARADFVNLF